MLAQDQSSSAKRGGLAADVSSELIFLKKKKKYIYSVTSSFLICVSFISFSCLIALARTSSTMLNRSQSRHSECVLKIKLTGFPKRLEFSDIMNVYFPLLEKELVPTEGASGPSGGGGDGLWGAGSSQGVVRRPL